MLNEELDNDSLELAEKLRAAIKPLGKGGKAHLAKRIGVTPQAITGWETTGKIGFLNLVQVAIETSKPLEFFTPSRFVVQETQASYNVPKKKQDYSLFSFSEYEIAALDILNLLNSFKKIQWLNDGLRLSGISKSFYHEMDIDKDEPGSMP